MKESVYGLMRQELSMERAACVTVLSQGLICRIPQMKRRLLWWIEQGIECNIGCEGKVGTNQFVQGSVGHFKTIGFYSKYNGKPTLITLMDRSNICVTKINLADKWEMDCSSKSHTGKLGQGHRHQFQLINDGKFN